jgi:hypothetical protein
MQLAIQQNISAQIVRLFLVDEQTARGRTSLTPHSDGLVIASLREKDLKPTRLDLRPWTGEPHIPGGFREIDSKKMPGLYELGLPDTLCAEGSRHATLMVQAPGVRPLVIHIDLIAYDPYDSYRLGLDCLTRESRHEVIARAFREVVPEIVEEFRGKINS